MFSISGVEICCGGRDIPSTSLLQSECLPLKCSLFPPCFNVAKDKSGNPYTSERDTTNIQTYRPDFNSTNKTKQKSSDISCYFVFLSHPANRLCLWPEVKGRCEAVEENQKVHVVVM